MDEDNSGSTEATASQKRAEGNKTDAIADITKKISETVMTSTGQVIQIQKELFDSVHKALKDYKIEVTETRDKTIKKIDETKNHCVTLLEKITETKSADGEQKEQIDSNPSGATERNKQAWEDYKNKFVEALKDNASITDSLARIANNTDEPLKAVGGEETGDHTDYFGLANQKVADCKDEISKLRDNTVKKLDEMKNRVTVEITEYLRHFETSRNESPNVNKSSTQGTQTDDVIQENEPELN